MPANRGSPLRTKGSASEQHASRGLQGRTNGPPQDTRERANRPQGIHLRSVPLQAKRVQFQGLRNERSGRAPVQHSEKDPSHRQKKIREVQSLGSKAQLDANAPSRNHAKRLKVGDRSYDRAGHSLGDYFAENSGEAAGEQSSSLRTSLEIPRVAKAREVPAQQSAVPIIARPGQSESRHMDGGARNTKRAKKKRLSREASKSSKFYEGNSSRDDNTQSHGVSERLNTSNGKSILRSAVTPERGEDRDALRSRLMNHDNNSNNNNISNRAGTRVTKKRKRKNRKLKADMSEEKCRIKNLRTFSSDFWNKRLD